MKRKCPPGKYYCYTDKKCKKIPKGFKVVGRMGYLRRENGFSKDEETKKNGNGSSNGNGNGGNGAGNGNGGSGGNGGGNGGGGMGLLIDNLRNIKSSYSKKGRTTSKI